MSRWILICLAVVLAGCGREKRSDPGAEADAALPAQERIRRRVELVFGGADQLMPENLQAGDPQSDLAPLILVRDGVPAGSFGVVRMDAAGRGHVAEGGATVYVDAGEILLCGRIHRQLRYHWYFKGRGESAFRAQGVAVVLDDQGQPRLWQVLHDASGLDVVYVAESTERRAAETFGPPLEGRRFAVERSPGEAPGVVVARALADGPVPMGPWVYLGRPAGDVTTLLCRCMPSQATGPLVRRDYELRRWEWPRDLPHPFGPARPDTPSAHPLERQLRLPGGL